METFDTAFGLQLPVVAASFLTVGFQTLASLAAGVLRMPLIAYIPALAMRSPVEAVVFTVLLVGVLVLIEVLNYRRQKHRDELSLLQARADRSPPPSVLAWPPAPPRQRRSPRSATATMSSASRRGSSPRAAERLRDQWAGIPSRSPRRRVVRKC